MNLHQEGPSSIITAKEKGSKARRRLTNPRNSQAALQTHSVGRTLHCHCDCPYHVSIKGPGPCGIPGYPGIPGFFQNPDPGILKNLEALKPLYS